MELKNWKDMYDYIEHIVQFIMHDNSVIVGFVDDVDVDFYEMEEIGFDVDTGCLSLPQPYKQAIPLTLVKLKDIKSMDIIE